MTPHRGIVLWLLTVGACGVFSMDAWTQNPRNTQKANTAQKPKKPPAMIEFDFDVSATEKKIIEVPVGSMIRISATRRSLNPMGRIERPIHTLRMEVNGEALEKFPTIVGEMRVRRKDSVVNPVGTTSSFFVYACHLRADRAGEANVKITVVELDGKLGESKEWKIVVTPEPQVDPAPKPQVDPAPKPQVDPAPKPQVDPAPKPQVDPAPLQLQYFDLQLQGGPQKERRIPISIFSRNESDNMGNMLQFEVVCPADKKHKDYIETIRIEDMDGDSVRVLDTVASAYREMQPIKGVVEDPTRRHVMCLIVTMKRGTTWLKATTIGADGMPVASKLFEIKVSHPGKMK
jgi:hypothetical protein